MLFGNIEEVSEISQLLLTSLEAGVSGKEFEEQVVGESFVGLADHMKHVYALYCRNHDEVIALLEKVNKYVLTKPYLKNIGFS